MDSITIHDPPASLSQETKQSVEKGKKTSTNGSYPQQSEHE